MGDFSLALIGSQTTHALPPWKEGGRWKHGQIQKVHLADSVADLIGGDYKIRGGIGSRILVFVHIKNVPHAIDDLEAQLLPRIMNDEGDQHLHRSSFRLRFSELPIGARTQLLSDREVTVEWAAIKPFLKHSVTDSPI